MRGISRVDRSYTHGGGDRVRSWEDIKEDVAWARDRIKGAYPGWYKRSPRGKNARGPLHYKHGVVKAWVDRDSNAIAGIAPKAISWFCGDALYSYRTRVGMFWWSGHDNNKLIALIDEHKYSVKTNELLWCAGCALRAAGIDFIEVSDVLSPSNSYESARREYASFKREFHNENPRAHKVRHTLAQSAWDAKAKTALLREAFPHLLGAMPVIPHDEDFFIESKAVADIYEAYRAKIDARTQAKWAEREKAWRSVLANTGNTVIPA